MHYVIAGSSGLIGTALVERLRKSGHTCTTLVRREERTETESAWDPPGGMIDPDVIASADIVINLAGASIGGKRLQGAYLEKVRSSRTVTTALLSTTLARTRPDGRLIQASAMGYYGTPGDHPLDETAPVGRTVLAGVVDEWESSTDAAVQAGVAVSLVRTSHVLAPWGGLADRLLPLVRLGLLRSMGNGRQWMPWISLVDAARAFEFLSTRDHRGPINLCSPHETTNREVIHALAHAADRPSLIPVPAWIIRTLIGPASHDMLNSQRLVPTALKKLGFEWTHPTIDTAAEYTMEKLAGINPTH